MEITITRIDLGGVNCYLGKQGDNYILFDTGGHLTMDKRFTNRRDILERGLEKAGCTQGKLKLVILTHGDNDHAANAAFIRKKYNVKIAMHSGDTKLVDNPSMEVVMKSFQYRSLLFRAVFKLMKKNIIKISEKTLNDFECFTPDICLKDGDSLESFGFDAKIIHIPGHTDGSIGVLMPNKDLICGDILTNGKKPAPAPNAYDFKLLSDSIKMVKNMKIGMVYPGHGEPFEMKLLG